MLNHQENEILTRVGPGTPLGRFLRRYWIPAALCEEIVDPGGAPVRVGLLGERLVAFRDPEGRPGLIQEFCPHRGASLVYARNEPGGLRCIYHGWKMGACGEIVETPAEPAGSRLRHKLRHVAYPVREAGGILWTYMGPPELEPPFPTFPWMSLPSSRLLVVKMYQDCNYLQGLEGDLDPAHPNYLHRDLDAGDASWRGAGWQSIYDLMFDGAPTIHCEDTPHMMRVVATRKTPDPNLQHVRVTEWVAPFYCLTASGPNESKAFKAWLPIDDHCCYTFYVHFHPRMPLDREAIYANWNHRTEGPDYRTPHTLANRHLQDRAQMIQGNYSGITGAAIQDRAVQESMGSIYDRTQEHLGQSDKAVVYYRRYMLRKIAEMERGLPLPGQASNLSFDLRSASCFMPADRPWQDAVAFQEEMELQQSSPSLERT